MLKKFFLFLLISPMFLFSKPMTIVTLQYPPYEYEEEGVAKGINVDIVKEAFKRLNKDIKIKFLPWKRALLMTKNGYADGIIDAAYNKKRASYLYFPKNEINTEQWYAFKKKNTPITLNKNLSNVKDISLGITRGFVYGGPIQELIENSKFKSIQEVSNNELNVKKLMMDRFDMFIGVKTITLNIIKKLNYTNDIEIVKVSNTKKDYLLNSSKTYLAFSKKTVSEKFSKKFSFVLEEMKKDGTIQKIVDLYN